MDRCRSENVVYDGVSQSLSRFLASWRLLGIPMSSRLLLLFLLGWFWGILKLLNLVPGKLFRRQLPLAFFIRKEKIISVVRALYEDRLPGPR